MVDPTRIQVADAFAAHSGATVLVWPREDGQFSDLSSDVLGLLDEAGVSADYAVDPMTAGVYGQRSADVYLPLLVLAASSDPLMVAKAIEGIASVVEFLTSRHRGHRVKVRAARFRRGDTELTLIDVTVDGRGTRKPSELVREALRSLLDDEKAADR